MEEILGDETKGTKCLNLYQNSSPATPDNDEISSLQTRLTQLEDLVALLAGANTLSTSASALTMDGSNGTYGSNVLADADLGGNSGGLISPLPETKLTLDASTDTVHILGDTAIGGNLTVGLITINDLGASINSLGEPLRLQNLALANVEIMGGKVVIDTKGNLKVEGEITAKKVTAEKVETKKLCVEDVCVTRDQFKKLLEKNEIN